MKRPNVTVITHAMVTRILSTEASVWRRIRPARQERDCQGGPRGHLCPAGRSIRRNLLELSGIGDATRLRDLGVAVVQTTPRWAKTCRTISASTIPTGPMFLSLNQVLRPWWGKALAGMEYLLLRSGPLSISMNQGGGFFRTDPSRKRANMQLYFQAFSPLVPKSRRTADPDARPWPGFSIGLSNCRPTSVGSIHIRSSNPLEQPRIVPNAFSTDHDVAEMLDAVKFLRKIAATPTMSRLIIEELLPGPCLPER